MLPNIKKVTKSRFIVKESYHLSVTEHRLILSCLSKVDRLKDVPNEITLTAKDYINDWKEVRPENAYRELSAACDKLYERDIKLRDPEENSRTRLRWVQFVKFMDGEGEIRVQFSNEIKPLLGSLLNNYVQFRISDVHSFKSSHTIRMFELLMQFKKTGFYAIKPEELRTAFALDDVKSYSQYKSLKQRVISVALSEINEKSKWEVHMEEVKKGRSVVLLKFYFSLKMQPSLF